MKDYGRHETPLYCSPSPTIAEKFNDSLSSLVMRDTTGSLVANPYITAHFAIGKKLKFSACGCFHIDYRLGYSMLATCITYLVILVELDSRRC
ncbi:hypothetical protein GE061_015780 [Apolygus lucorum]|uniref:Gustatory receptor n=1 Tax=Apolygus lucorum TaxID=248454 RepID=A0A6A4JBN1_APOLU|nr:hypothetical protein GE061_015780 [Apolygus lucorum]